MESGSSYTTRRIECTAHSSRHRPAILDQELTVQPFSPAFRIGLSFWLLLAWSVRASAAEPDTVSYSRAGADTCLTCHEDETTLAIFHGPHGNPNDPQVPFGHNQLQCEACHGPGGNHARRVPRGQERPAVVRFGRNAPTSAAVQNKMCAACHVNDLGAAWHGSAHDSNKVACAACHRSHEARDPVQSTSTQPDICGTCHKVVRAEHHRAFTHPLDDGKMSCSSCHKAHGSVADAALIRQTLNATCHECHADKRGPFLWEHAPVAEDCTTCHTPHGSNHPGMLRQRGPMLCQNCHSEAGHPAIAAVPATGLPGGSRSSYVAGMNCLNCHSQIHGSNHPSGSKLMR